MERIEYTVENKGKMYKIHIETSRAESLEGRPASRDGILEVAGELEKELEAVTVMAGKVLDGLKSLHPGKVEFEFGIELGGTVGIPLITEGTAKANFKVTLAWEGGGNGSA